VSKQPFVVKPVRAVRRSSRHTPYGVDYKRGARLSRAARSRALRKETDRALTDQIRRLLALPMNKRTNFLRVRLPGGGSAL
jgi:hypothetical protein